MKRDEATRLARELFDAGITSIYEGFFRGEWFKNQNAQAPLVLTDEDIEIICAEIRRLETEHAANTEPACPFDRFGSDDRGAAIIDVTKEDTSENQS